MPDFQETETERLVAPRGPDPETLSMIEAIKGFNQRHGLGQAPRKTLGSVAEGMVPAKQAPPTADPVFKDQSEFDAITSRAAQETTPLNKSAVKRPLGAPARDPFSNEPGLRSQAQKEMTGYVQSIFDEVGLGQARLSSGKRDWVKRGMSKKPSFHEVGYALDFGLKEYSPSDVQRLRNTLNKSATKIRDGFWRKGETDEQGNFSGYDIIMHSDQTPRGLRRGNIRGGMHLHIEKQSPETSTKLKEYMRKQNR
jgi:hypothetical protein